MELIRSWFRRHFADPQVVVLAMLILVCSLIILFFGRMLAPVLAAIVVAYLLEAVVSTLQKWKVPRLVAVYVVSSLFVVLALVTLFALLPLLFQQLGQLFQRLPYMIAQGQQELMKLPERYPDFISQQQLEQQVTQILDVLRSELTTLGQRVLSFSMASLLSIFTFLVYLFIVPLLVFFCLKDKDAILRWITGFMPEDRRLASKVWREVDLQIGNYVRGKVWEILIVWSASYLTFALLGLDFAMLLGLFVGLSVLIPYIGAIFMGLPVALVAYFQWGWSPQFSSTVIAYVIIQFIDGNILVTLLFSEVVNLHPLAIISAVLVFGGLWGFWGLFFSIPLATLVQAVLKAWPKHSNMKTMGEKDVSPSVSPSGYKVTHHG